ncbi:unnamed protein product [Lathyrus oleraceus]
MTRMKRELHTPSSGRGRQGAQNPLLLMRVGTTQTPALRKIYFPTQLHQPNSPLSSNSLQTKIPSLFYTKRH